MYDNHISIAHIDGSSSVALFHEVVGRKPYTVLYFYPKDCTSGCTIEAIEFSQLINDFTACNAQVLWVSKDSLTSHHKFITESHLGVDLISDTDTTLHQSFGAWWAKSMYGRSYMWAIRSTFILDITWQIIKEYRNVTARGHAQQVLQDLRAIITE